MNFKEFLALDEMISTPDPKLHAVKRAIGQEIRNTANRPNMSKSSAKSIINKAIINKAEQDPASVSKIVNSEDGLEK